MEKIEVKIYWADKNYNACCDSVGSTVVDSHKDLEALKSSFADLFKFHLSGLIEEGTPISSDLANGNYELNFTLDTSLTKATQIRNVRQELSDISLDVSWRAIARRYFNRSAAWLYHRLDATDVNNNGKPAQFTPDELETLREALCDISNRLRQAADKL